jgi:hypothetical protein
MPRLRASSPRMGRKESRREDAGSRHCPPLQFLQPELVDSPSAIEEAAKRKATATRQASMRSESRWPLHRARGVLTPAV